MKRLWVIAAVLGGLGLAVALVLWRVPSDEFIFTPGRAQPLAERVEVEDAKPAGSTSIHYVDVFVRRLTWLEELLPFTRPDGSTVVPEAALLPPGTSEEERDRRNAEDMLRSERIASLVALRALGFDVKATPKGALVAAVAPGIPATQKLDTGDLIVGVDGKAVLTPDELRTAIGRRKPGDAVLLDVRRGGETVEVSVETIENPDAPGKPIVGIQVEQEADIRLPINVDIDLGRVGGPSAGLPFALEIVRMLGRDITSGCTIAATGELALDGSVIQVGGIPQKTIGALRTGVDVLLVPAGMNAQDAQRYADGIQVIPVESFQQALQRLATARLTC